LLVSFIFYNIEYLIYCFVLRGRRIEGLAGAKPLYELPRLLRLLLGSVFAYGSLGVFVRAMEGRERGCRRLVFGWLNSDLVWLVKELPLTAIGW